MQTAIDPKRLDLGSDEAIVGRVSAGETRLFEVLVRRYNQRLFRAARAITGSDVEAEDVMQEAYVQAYSHLAQFREEARFSTWLTRIAVHEALARRRRAQRQAPMEQAPMQEPTALDTPEHQAGTRELAGLLERAIDELPDSFREVFVLRAVEEMSVAETAEVLDVPEDTVKTRLFRARGLLREAIAERALGAAPEAFSFHAPRCNAVVAVVMERIRKHP